MRDEGVGLTDEGLRLRDEGLRLDVDADDVEGGGDGRCVSGRDAELLVDGDGGVEVFPGIVDFILLASKSNWSISSGLEATLSATLSPCFP